MELPYTKAAFTTFYQYTHFYIYYTSLVYSTLLLVVHDLQRDAVALVCSVVVMV